MQGLAIVFVVVITLVLPLLFCVVGVIKQNKLPFLLGVLTFTISQMLIRIPLLSFLIKELPSFILLQATSPILFLLLLSFSAGLFEEGARWLTMTFFMKGRKSASALYFGLGHGGIEAILIVGIPVLTQLSVMKELDLFLSGFERILAMIVHVTLSMVVYYSVRAIKASYLVLAIVLHGVVNFVVTWLAATLSIYVAEGVFILLAALLIWLAIILTKRVKRYEN